MFPHEGVVHYNSSTGPHPHPSISLQIVDLSHQHETNDVQIGQNLELQIVAEYSPHPEIFIFNNVKRIRITTRITFKNSSLKRALNSRKLLSSMELRILG